MASHRTDPARLDQRLAELWARTVAAELADWGHGVLAPDAPSGGVAISGLANARGCCLTPMPIQRSAGTFALRAAAGTHTSCLACRRQLPVTLWASWKGPGAAAVCEALASARLGKLDPPARTHTKRSPWRRASASAPTRRMSRVERAWNAAGLPAPRTAVEAAEHGRGACQTVLADTAADRCEVLLESLTRRGQPITELPTTAVAPLRVCIEDTHGLTIFEPELIVGDTHGRVTAAFLQPTDAAGRPAAPAAEPAPDGHRRTRCDERDWPHPVISEPAAHLDDADPVALTLRCVPSDLVVSALRRPRHSQTLAQLWAQALSGNYNGADAPPSTTAPTWLCDETVENRLRNVLAAIDRPPRGAPPASRGITR